MSKRGRKMFATGGSSPFSRQRFKTKPKGEHPYGDDWPSISAAVRKRDNYTCRAHVIGLPTCQNRYPPPFHHLLHVHHIVEYAKCRQHDMRNLITLCRDCHDKCHGHTNYKRITLKQRLAAQKFKD